jgi:hypothetical protein
MTEPHKKHPGRGPSPDPRFIHKTIRLTAAEAIELERRALFEGVTVATLLRRGISSSTGVTTLDCNTTRRTA